MNNISHIFNKFAGREIDMNEVNRTITVGGQAYPYVDVQPADDNDPLLQDMENEAQKNGLSLRVWWPGMAGTMDYRLDRVNAHIEKGTDGKWRIGNRFDLG